MDQKTVVLFCLLTLSLSTPVDRRQSFEGCDLAGFPGLLPRIHELHACYASRDAPAEYRRDIFSYHIFKSGGTSVANVLDVYCNRTEQLSVWPGKRRVQNFALPGAYTMTTVRDPIDRFLSAYHEVKKREAEHKSRGRVARNVTRERLEATPERRLKRFHAFLASVERQPRRRKVDPHYAQQVAFLTHAGGAKVRLDSVLDIAELSEDAVFRIGRRVQGWHRLPGRLPDGSGGMDGLRARRKESVTYGLPMYVVHRKELDDGVLRRIAAMYVEDFACFGYQRPV